MYGWFEESTLRDSNGELSSHLLPPPVEYISYSDYLVQHPNITQTPEIKNLSFNVSLVTSSPPTIITQPPPTPEPLYCIDNRILYAIAALAAFFLFLIFILLIVLIRCYRSLKHPK